MVKDEGVAASPPQHGYLRLAVLVHVRDRMAYGYGRLWAGKALDLEYSGV